MVHVILLRALRTACTALLPLGLLSAAILHAQPTIDTATQGNWIGVYGADGYILPNYAGPTGNTVNATLNSKVNDKAVLPSFISSYDYGNVAQGFIWAAPTSDMRAPQDPDNPGGDRVANTVYDGDYNITLNISQATEFELGIYGLDWDGTGRDMAVTINGEIADFENSPNQFNQGLWAIWTIAADPGPLTISIDHQTGNNSVISAITFDEILQPVPEPTGLAAWSLLGLGAAVVGTRWRKRKR